jgi:hypothetical protein
MVLWAMSKNKARGGRRASADTQRSLSAVWLQVVQALTIRPSSSKEFEACPQCGSRWCKRNGHLHMGTPNRRCQAGGRAFGLTPDTSVITEEPRGLSARLLRERIARRGICRAVGVGLQWLLMKFDDQNR